MPLWVKNDWDMIVALGELSWLNFFTILMAHILCAPPTWLSQNPQLGLLPPRAPPAFVTDYPIAGSLASFSFMQRAFPLDA